MEAFSKLGIDFVSIGLYLLNTGVLVAIIAYFAVNPILGFLDKRISHIEGNINEADTLKSEFQKKLAQMQQEQDDSSRKIKEQVETTKQTLEAQKLALEETAHKEKEKLLAEARLLIGDEKAQLLKSAEQDTLTLIQKILFDVLENKVPKEAIEASVLESWKHYSAR